MTHTQVIVYPGVFRGLVGLRCVWLCRGWGEKHLHDDEEVEEEEEEAEGEAISEYVGGCKHSLAGGASCLASNGILRFTDKPRPLSVTTPFCRRCCCSFQFLTRNGPTDAM